MKLLNVLEMAKERRKGQRRMDLFRRESLKTCIPVFLPATFSACTTIHRTEPTTCSPGREL